ncbi:hypothetical protein F5144DRAFT_590281 [Chaetomium tenue]|uniref:Uncharacterized protein n=1 Tax=Chaetomium tenue TaxID=1854479 RepID=A0ACB7PH19_9PEZI|nr:hypothetical protein F5144DRAFT_590281 [Chaetomium globosum]
MNIACHSSFDTNLRVRVATATGQKDLQTKSTTKKSNPPPQAAPVATVPTCFNGGDASALAGHNPYDAAVDTKSWGTQNLSGPSGNRQGTDFDSALLSDPWSFSIPPPASPSFYVASCAQPGFPAAESSVYSPLYLDPSAMEISYFQPSNPNFDSHSETSSFVNAQSQEGLRGDAWFQYAATNHPRITERGGNPEKIRESQRKRHAPVEVVDEVIAMWEDHRRTAYDASQYSAKINGVQKQIGPKKKACAPSSRPPDLEKEKKELLASAAEKEKLLRIKVKTIGNLVHDSVPVSKTESWADEGLDHEVLDKLDGYDPERGVKVVGHRGAIINYGLEFLHDREYVPLQTPQLMLRDQMAKTAQLSQFDEELYKVTGDQADKYLIATSEQPISAYHSDEWLQPKELPLKYAGYSTCFRKEAGAHGKDVWGIFRVHEFTKVEQFCITDPEKSWEMFENMISTSEDFYKSLGIPHHSLDNAAAKKLDLEAWFPHQGEFKELVSCSNCTDYQSRDLEIRFGIKKQTDAKKIYVHCLNSTLTATTRTICAILENFQTEEGVNIPEPLRKYLPGAPAFIPFAKQAAEKKEGDKKEGDKKEGGKKEIPVR